MDIFLKVILVSLAVTRTSCSIGGLSYMDPINQRPLPNDARRNEVGDPCHPLFWYPKAVPEYCKQKFTPPSGPRNDLTTPAPIRVPIPVPSQPIPYPVPFLPPPMPMPYPVSPYYMQPLPPPLPTPMVSMPYGMPVGPILPPGVPALPPFPGMFPAQFPAPAPPPAAFGPQAGLVPGVHGLVSSDGAINIMPFSDVYSTMLEKHKHEMISKHMEYVKKKYGGRKKHARRRIKVRKSRQW